MKTAEITTTFSKVSSKKQLSCNCLDFKAYTQTQDNSCTLNEKPLCVLVQYCVSEQIWEKGALADVTFISEAVFLQDSLFPGYLLPPKEETNFGTEAGMRLQIKDFFTVRFDVCVKTTAGWDGGGGAQRNKKRMTNRLTAEQEGHWVPPAQNRRENKENEKWRRREHKTICW